MSPPPLASGAPASTREKILAYLREQRLASVQVLSRQFGLTRADVRYHLKHLLDEGIVEITGRDTSRPAPRGRPQLFFRLAVHKAPDNYASLCGALLDALRASSPDPWRKVSEQMISAPHTTGSAVQRFNDTVQYLNQHSYNARWEAHSAGPRILLRNCPYAAILPVHPELCEIDRTLVERLTRTPQQLISRINLSGGKPAACVFVSLRLSPSKSLERAEKPAE